MTLRAPEPASPEPATIRFSTGDLPPSERIPFVGEAMGRYGLDFQPLPGEPFRLDAVQDFLPGLNVVSVVNSGIRMARTRRRLADGDDSLDLAVVAAGSETFSQLGRDVTVADGEAVLLSNADTYEAVCPAGKRFLGLRLPRVALAGLVPNVEDRFAQAIPRDRAALRLLASYVGMLRDNDDALATPELRRLTVSYVYDLVALALGANADAAPLAKGRGLAAARLCAIKSDIAAHLGDGSLSVVAVAARQEVTPRYVQMLFESEGMTFSQYVLATRLAHARRMLSDLCSAGRTITAIAFAAGFSDLSHFNRAFRRAYGTTPSDVRAAARRDG
jgi:AraC-like DNA-binding protein